MSNIDNNKRIALNTLFLYIRMGVVMFIALYTTRIVFNVLGEEDYGIYNVVCTFVAMFGIFNTCFTSCISRFYNYEIGKKTKNKIRNVFNTSILIQFILALIIAILIEIVGYWYINNYMVLPIERLETAKWIFHFAIISMFLTIIQAPFSALVLAYEKMDYFAFVSICDALFKLLFIIVLQHIQGDKLLFYGTIMLIISIINFSLYFIYCRLRFSEIRLHFSIDKQMLRSMLSFAGWNLLDPAAYMARDQGTNMVLNSYFGPIANAAHGIAYQISTAVDNFSNSFSISFRPQIIQSYSEGQFDRTKKLMLSMSKICFMLHVLIVVPIILENKYILNFWLGEEYPAYASSFASIILCITGISLLNAPVSTVVSATGNIRKMKIFSAIVITSIIPISIILFRFGLPPLAAYVCLLGLTIINQIGSIIILHQLFPYIEPTKYFKHLIIPLFIYTICVFIFPYLINSILTSSFIRLLLVTLTSIISGLLSGYFIVLDGAEKNIIHTLIKNKIR